MIKACIFDLDGTLLDTLASLHVRLCEKLQEYSVTPITKEQTRRFVGDGARQLVTRALDADQSFSYTPEELDKFHCDFVETYNANPFDLTVPYDGIEEMLKKLKECGMKLAVLSNKPDATTRQLCDKFFPGIFDVAFGARAGVALKPDAEGAFEILRLLGVSAEETAYFGDTAVDIATALNYGAGLNVGVLWGFRDEEDLVGCGATSLIKHPSEIIELLKTC